MIYTDFMDTVPIMSSETKYNAVNVNIRLTYHCKEPSTEHSTLTT
jgi:hypothetical protein